MHLRGQLLRGGRGGEGKGREEGKEREERREGKGKEGREGTPQIFTWIDTFVLYYVFVCVHIILDYYSVLIFTGATLCVSAVFAVESAALTRCSCCSVTAVN